MQSKKGLVILVLLIFCLFIGILGISLGLGTALPTINKIAQPIVCPQGSMTSETRLYKPYPGKNVMTASWYCVDDQTQAVTTLSKFPIHLFAGSVHGLILFLLLYLLIIIKGKKAGSTVA